MAEPTTFDLPHMQELQTAEQKKLFDAIDSLRSYGLGNITSLPQLVVCGGQSTGKSSVLEAISGVPFPRNVGLCTRFPTEVILRRDTTIDIKVSLAPGPGRSSKAEKKLRDFKHELTSYEELPELVTKATEAMNYSTTRSGMTFSDDVLRIEVSGPKQPQLSIVDLPGIIQSGTDDITNEDISLVEQLVMGYISKPRSIILAIITATTDPENQVVLRKARDADPSGSRTLGIITKPDTLTKGSLGESKWLALARNERSKLKLGWHVVKNVDSNAVIEGGRPQKDRDAEEAAFFRGSRFKADPGRKLGVGIASLRERLSKILFDQIRDTIHPLLKDMEIGMSKCKEELKKLGEARSTPEAQRTYLNRISTRFSQLCKAARDGHYQDEFFDESRGHTRLCARLREGHDKFATDLRKAGTKWQVSRNGRPRISSVRVQAISDAVKLLRRNRGTELPGLQNPSIIHDLFKQHSKPWENIAKEHIRESRLKIEHFLNDLASTLASKDVCENLIDHWIRPRMNQNLDNAHLELTKLTNVHKQPPLTMNQNFGGTVHRIQGEIERERELQAANGSPESNGVSLAEFGNEEVATAMGALGVMQAYYEIALDLFTDNVPTLVVWATMVNDLDKIFSPDVVDEMGDAMRASIAEEPPHITERRKEMQTRYEILKKGQDECELQISKSHFTSRRVPTFEMDQVASKLSNASISGNTNGASATGTEDEDEDEDEEVEEEEDDL